MKSIEEISRKTWIGIHYVIKFHQLDVKIAFFHGNFKEAIPERDKSEKKSCLRKSVYGLNQAAR